MKHYKAILYDLDGTLLDTYEMNTASLARILVEAGYPKPTEIELKRYYAMPGMAIMLELKAPNPDALYARWVEVANTYSSYVFEGVEQLLKTGKELGYLQGIVSSKMRRQYGIDFVSRGLADSIDVAILKDDTELHKPHPEPLLKACAELKIKPHEAIYLGDAITDYLACKAAGMDFGYARWGSVNAEGIETPQYSFKTVQDVIDWLKLLGHALD